MMMDPASTASMLEHDSRTTQDAGLIWGTTVTACAYGLLLDILILKAYECGGHISKRQLLAALPPANKLDAAHAHKLFAALGGASSGGKVQIDGLFRLRESASNIKASELPPALLLGHNASFRPLKRLLATHAAEAINFFRLWDYDGDGRVGRRDFGLAMQVGLGFSTIIDHQIEALQYIDRKLTTTYRELTESDR